jgi:hypothetical protein
MLVYDCWSSVKYLVIEKLKIESRDESLQAQKYVSPELKFETEYERKISHIEFVRHRV